VFVSVLSVLFVGARQLVPGARRSWGYWRSRWLWASTSSPTVPMSSAAAAAMPARQSGQYTPFPSVEPQMPQGVEHNWALPDLARVCPFFDSMEEPSFATGVRDGAFKRFMSLSVRDAGPSSINGLPMCRLQVRRNCAASAAISTAIGWQCRPDSPFTGAPVPLRGTSTGSN
jgi:hypothetical protein